MCTRVNILYAKLIGTPILFRPAHLPRQGAFQTPNNKTEAKNVFLLFSRQLQWKQILKQAMISLKIGVGTAFDKTQ